MTERELSGWGRSTRSLSTVAPLNAAAALQAFEDSTTRGVLARGLGRSYGDAAQNAGGLVLQANSTESALEMDSSTGVIQVSAETTLDSLIRWSLPKGWFVSVTPGTRYVTVGGAIAADVHGKNHHRDGGFSGCCKSIDLVTPESGPVSVLPGEELFDATTGGMGLTGIITRAEIQLEPIETAWMNVDNQRAQNLEQLLDRLVIAHQESRFVVAWIDLLARGDAVGRGVVSSGEYASLDQLDSARAQKPLDFAPRSLLTIPKVTPQGLLNRWTGTAFNQAWYRRAGGRETSTLESIAGFFHPLDGIQEWNRLYGERGFIQYQFVVPNESLDTLRGIVEQFAKTRTPSFLAVLKRFGPQGSGHLSFPLEGWTLAVDLPAIPEVAPFLDQLDERVVDAGGRVYLAKDARLRRQHVKKMYPRLEEWRQIRRTVDPKLVLTSDMDRRLDLSGRS